MCSHHDIAHIYTQVDENGDDVMAIGYTNFNLSTKGGWEAAMTTLEMVHVCSLHGRTYGTEPTKCHDDWHRQCDEATYGPPCMACGRIAHDIPQDTDEAHFELCCGNKVHQSNDYANCQTHGVWPN